MPNAALSPHRLAVATAVATLSLMTIGSLVHGTGSSLACPDWPLCHDTFFPSMTGGVEFEHTHRLVALAVVVLTGLLFAFTLRARDPRATRLAATGVSLVLVQAALGGATVLLRLPTLVSVAHLATAMTFLAVLVTLAVRASPSRPAPPESLAAVRPLVTAALGLVLVQCVLGAFVRHTGAAFACLDLPLCQGTALPAGALARLHVAHRAVGVAAFALAAAAAVTALRRATGRIFRFAAILPLVLATLQVALGVTVVFGGVRLDVVTWHHLGGALLLASLALLRALVSADVAPVLQYDRRRSREPTP